MASRYHIRRLRPYRIGRCAQARDNIALQAQKITRLDKDYHDIFDQCGVWKYIQG